MTDSALLGGEGEAVRTYHDAEFGQVGATYQLVHGTADHVLGHDDGAGDGEDGAILVLSRFESRSL